MRGNYLITTDNWFLAPDGKPYRAVWGYVEIIEDTFLGIKTNKNSSNWFAKIGEKGKEVIVAGCQIHYAIRCEEAPNVGITKDYNTSAEVGCKEYERPTQIWLAN